MLVAPMDAKPAMFSMIITNDMNNASHARAREALEQHGTVPNSRRLEPMFTAEPEALVQAIDELARSGRPVS